MKKLLIIAALALTTSTLFAQTETKSESTWEENTDGKGFSMKASTSGSSRNVSTKPHISFKIDGNTANLTKVAFVGKGLLVAVPISKKQQDINVAAGSYKFKFYHSKLGVKEFDVDLENGDDKTVMLTLK